MSKLPDYDPKTKFRIEPPHGRGKSFRIRYKEPGKDWVQLNLKEIELANESMNSGKTSLELTKAKLKHVLAAQYSHRDRKKSNVPFLSKNLQIVENLWRTEYTERRLSEMKRPQYSRQNLDNAAEACGLLPIDTCSVKELENHLHGQFKANPSRLRRRIIWVNCILTWLKRETIENKKLKRPRVKYLTEEEFLTVLPYITDPIDKILARIAFYTGARLGEIFGLERIHVKDGRIEIETQMMNIVDVTKTKNATKQKSSKSASKDSKGKKTKKVVEYQEGTPKNGESRESFFPERVKPDIEAWLKVSTLERSEIRMKRFSKVIKDACKKALGESDSMKLLTFRDLRHCHAIWLLHNGATIAEVAQQIGDGIEVCFRHYAGHELKKESIDRFKRMFDEQPKGGAEKTKKTSKKSS